MEDFKFIESAYTEIKKGKASASIDLADGLSNHFGRNITVAITPKSNRSSIFVMSVTPEKSIIDKISGYMVGTENKLQVISNLWHSCQNWRLDIDSSLFDFLEPNELTALTLHEMKHIMDTDRVPSKIVNSVQFMFSTSKLAHKAMLHNRDIQKILSLPILATCQSFFDKNRMKTELKAERRAMEKEYRADAYAKKSGYLDALLSAMNKLEKRIKNDAYDKNTKDAITYTSQLINSLEKRKDFMLKIEFSELRKFAPEGVFRECVDDVYNSWFYKDELEDYIVESVSDINENIYFTEFGSKLEPIEQNQLDYIYVRIESMETVNDKMMILSYINSKLELVSYYIDILGDKKLSRKYKVPHSMEKLQYFKVSLEKLREKALNKPLPSNDKNIVVYYPAGYEG